MLAESAVRSLIRLIVTVAILGAIYLFFVKPVLDTTENTVNRAFDESSSLQRHINSSLQAQGLQEITLTDPGSIGRNIGNVDLSTAIANAPDKQTKRLLKCIDRANGDLSKITKCTTS